MVESLLQNGADPNAQSNFDGSTSLHEAVLGGRQKIIEILLSNGAVQT